MAKLAPHSDPRCERGKQRAPVLCLAHLERLQGEAVAGDMLLRDGVPATMLDRHTRLFFANGLEADLDVRGLVRREGPLPPVEREPLALDPSADAADLEGVAVRQVGDEPAVFARLKAKLAITTRRELEESIGFPPEPDLSGEDVKCLLRRRLHTQRDNDRGGHFRFFSICALNDES